MDINYQTTAVIRQRGQLTIPGEIRQVLSWIKPLSIISIITRSKEEVIIRPYKAVEVSGVDWKKIWEKIELARSFTGKRGDLSDFIAKDRKRH